MQRTIKIILSWLLVFAIPISAMGISLNIAMRIPDLYQYKMNSDQILSEFDASSQEEKLAKHIARYMQHRADGIQYQTDEEDEMSLLFTRAEENAAARFRMAADILAFLTLIMLFILAIGCIWLIKDEHYRLIRARTKAAVFVFIIFEAVEIAAIFTPQINVFIKNLFIAEVAPEAFLSSLLDPGFMILFFIISTIMEIVIITTVIYLIWKKTRPRTMFRY